MAAMFDASSPSVWSTTVHEDRRRACLRTCQSRRQVNWPWSRRRVTALASWLPFSEPTIVQHLVVNGCLGHCWVQYTAALQAYFDSRMSFAVQWSKLACPCGGRCNTSDQAYLDHAGSSFPDAVHARARRAAGVVEESRRSMARRWRRYRPDLTLPTHGAG
ncbi:hypothetical protein LIA77_09544 [Sarocladium implicatum]|nr:hypothetical protein LIA77_09544 [Sarocladium implicatum]